LFSLAMPGLHVSCSSRDTAEPHLNGPVGLVRFPEPWFKVSGDREIGVNDNIGYVVRKSSRGELLFAVKQGYGRTIREGSLPTFQ